MSEVFERLVRERGIGVDYLRPKYESLGDPYELPDMKEAVERMKLAGERGEKVVVYGDYDVDGVCAAVIMRQALLWAGVEEVAVLLPDRFGEGYGLNNGAVEEVIKLGAGLVVTVDCGSGSREVVAKMKEKGVDVVVTDHHECPEELPECLVVNPKRGEVVRMPLLAKDGEGSTSRELCGAGVAYQVARAIKGDGQEKWLLDLVLLATVCDSVMLDKDNRILTYYGMKVLQKTRRVGLRELMKKAGVERLDGYAVGFLIGPRLNAGGRMGSAYRSLELLLTESRVDAVGLAEELDDLNMERRRVQRAAVAEVEEMGCEDAVVVVRGGWHEGVIGIIAGRLVEKWRKPCFVFTEAVNSAHFEPNPAVRTRSISNTARLRSSNSTSNCARIDDSKLLKGSARSFGDFDLALALSECQDCLVRGGGHSYAAGMTIASEKFDEFRERMNKYYEGLGLRGQERFFEVKEDVAVKSLEELNVDLLAELAELEPYGEGNEEPIFKLQGMLVNESAMMGQNKEHLRLGLRDGKGNYMKCVGFGAPEEWRVPEGEKVDVWVKLRLNEWRGTKNVEGMILRVEKNASL